MHTHTASLVLLGLLFALSACSDESTESGNGSSSLKVIASTYPLEYFAATIGGERVDVRNIVPAGGEAHDFEPTPGDLRDIAGADVIVYNGLGFESWVDAILDGGDAPDVAIQAGSEAIALNFDSNGISDHAGEHDDHTGENLDPHLWLDPIRAVTQVRAIASGLARADPEWEAFYNSNADELVTRLQDLDARISRSLTACELDVFVTSHDSFNYLADRYGKNAVGIGGINPEAEPSPGTLADLSDAVKDAGIGHVLVSPIDSERLSGTLLRETGTQALPLHSLQNLTRDERNSGEDYFTLMDANVESLITALRCGE